MPKEEKIVAGLSHQSGQGNSLISVKKVKRKMYIVEFESDYGSMRDQVYITAKSKTDARKKLKSSIKVLSIYNPRD